MKARSLILTHVQMPHRLAGMPPLVALALFTVFVAMAVTGLVLGFGGAGFFGGIGMCVVAWGWMQVKLRQDPHAFGVGWMQAAFWKGRAAGSRVFLAGSSRGRSGVVIPDTKPAPGDRS